MSLASLWWRNSRIANSTSSGLSSTSKTSTLCGMCHSILYWKLWFLARFVLGGSQRKEKRRSVIELRFRPNPPTVFPNDALHYGQPSSWAFELGSLAHAVE